MLGVYKLKKDAKDLNLFSSFTESLTLKGLSLYTPTKVFSIEDTLIYIQGKIFNILDLNLNIQDYDDHHEKLVYDLYLKYGDSFSEYLDGHFLILIFDKGDLKLFNNRYLATGLYYYYDRDYLLFGKSFKELIECIPGGKEVNKDVVMTFLSNGWNPTDKTMIKGVYKILPTYSIFASEEVKISNHWGHEFSFERKPIGNLENKMDEYESLYKSGIEKFIYQEKTNELGTLLSGGHDTSFTLIEASKVHSKPLHSFTATFPGWAFDEGDFAENIAKKFNSIHHKVPFTPDDMDYMVSLIIANEEPVVGSSLPVHLCAKEASKHVDSMLAGDGGDTLWGEYFPVAEFHSYIKNLPLSARKLIHKLSTGLRKTFDWERFWELEHVTELFSHENFYEGFLRRLCTYRHFSDEFQASLLTPEFRENSKYAKSSLELEFTKDNFSEMLIEGKLFNGFYTYQSFHTHRSMNHFNMELYLPTINRDFMRLITELPKEWVNGGTTFHRLTNSLSVNRRFHKKVLSRYLKKEEIYNRSFDVPWYNILRPRIELLNKLKERLIKRGWYNEKTIESMFSEFLVQEVKDYELLELKHHGYRIFTLLSLEIWCMEFLDNKNTKNFDEKISLEDYLSL